MTQLKPREVLANDIYAQRLRYAKTVNIDPGNCLPAADSLLTALSSQGYEIVKRIYGVGYRDSQDKICVVVPGPTIDRARRDLDNLTREPPDDYILVCKDTWPTETTWCEVESS